MNANLILSQLVNEQKEGQVLQWGGILLGMVVLGFGTIMLLRRYFKQSDGQGQYDAGFSLSDLRAMRDRGEITSEEYEQTRARVIAKVKNKSNQAPSAKPKNTDREDPESSA